LGDQEFGVENQATEKYWTVKKSRNGEKCGVRESKGRTFQAGSMEGMKKSMGDSEGVSLVGGWWYTKNQKVKLKV